MKHPALRSPPSSNIYVLPVPPRFHRFQWDFDLSPPTQWLISHVISNHFSIYLRDYSLVTTTIPASRSRYNYRRQLSSHGPLEFRTDFSQPLLDSSTLCSTRFGTTYANGYRMLSCLRETCCAAPTAAGIVSTRPHRSRYQPSILFPSFFISLARPDYAPSLRLEDSVKRFFWITTWLNDLSPDFSFLSAASLPCPSELITAGRISEE